MLGVTFWPVISTFILSFLNAPTGINQVRTFVGFGNYIDMLKDQLFWETIGRTLYFTVVSVGLELILGLAIAQLIHSRPWGWQFLRIQPDHSLGSADHCQRSDVALDLQR